MLGVYDFLVQLLSFCLSVFEAVAVAVTFLIPAPIIDAISKLLSALMPLNNEEREIVENRQLSDKIDKVSDALSFTEICRIHGYESTEHVVATPDGFMLGIHRIQPKTSAVKDVVYLHHGLLMNSEIWVACPDPHYSIAFQLADAGYEVWLGNNRGNKYSKKHLTKSPLTREFWNFCIDEFALYDIPTIVDYVLKVSQRSNLVYIGFSQGSAQAFASLSIYPELNDKVKLFIALGPTLAPPQVGPRFLLSLIKASPYLLYHLFGHRVILRSTVFWQTTMIPKIFVRMIDFANLFLFKWKSKNISWAQKLTGYSHLYSYTSVKCVVHWFQIIVRGRGIHMFDDNEVGFFGSHLSPASRKFYQVPSYPICNITTPIELIYGTEDSLVNVDYLKNNLPRNVGAFPVEGYEHLEMIWGKKVPTVIVPRILKLLRVARKNERDSAKINEVKRLEAQAGRYY